MTTPTTDPQPQQPRPPRWFGPLLVAPGLAGFMIAISPKCSPYARG
ncbi:hypothetical protein [Streptomyces sp. NBC_00354]